MITYAPHLKNISKIIKKHIKHLYADPEFRSVFIPLPFVSFCFVRNLRCPLMRSLLYCQEPKKGSFHQSCLSDTFTSHVSKETFKTNNHFYCNISKCLIYLLSCKLCWKKYVALTTDKFRYRWSNYKNCQGKAERGEDHMQKYLHDHLLSEYQ